MNSVLTPHKAIAGDCHASGVYWLAVSVMLLLLAGLQPAQAQTTDDPVIRSPLVVESESAAEIETQEAPTGDAAEPMAPEALQDELRMAIEAIETRGGPFDASLQEPLQGLADSLAEQGDYSEALQLYARLLHINRVNQGLYDESQFEIVDKVIDGNMALQDWQALNDSQEYYYFLSQRVHAQDDAKLLQSLNQHIEWKLTFLGLDTSRDKSHHLLALNELTEQAVELTDELNRDDKLALARSYYRRAMIHYYFAVAIDRSQETGHELSRRRSNTTAAMLNPNYIPSNLETNPQLRQKFSKGEANLDDVLALFSEPAEKQQMAMATVYLGDWYLLRDRRSSALDAYRDAFNLLKESGLEVEMINQLFARPVAIPVVNPSFNIEELQLATVADAETKNSPPVNKVESEEVNQQEQTSNEGNSAADGRVRLANYYAWSDTLPGVHFPFGGDINSSIVNQENYIDVEFTVAVVGKELATVDPRSSGFQRYREGRGNARNVEVTDADTSKEKTRWEGLDDIDQLMFRPQLVDGEAVEAKVTMRYIFAPDQ